VSKDITLSTDHYERLRNDSRNLSIARLHIENLLRWVRPVSDVPGLWNATLRDVQVENAAKFLENSK